MKRLSWKVLAGAALGVAAVAAAAPKVRELVSGNEDLTLDELRGIMPKLAEAKAREYLPYLNKAMSDVGISSTVPRMAAFLAQIAHESAELRYWEEIASGEAYEGRSDLGNTQPGDGKRYKGRGPIQLTGRYNYRKAGEALGLELEDSPADAALLSVGFRTAAWFWESHGLNARADAGDFVGVTREINGGVNGLAQRELYHARALEVLAHRRAQS